MNFAQSRVSNIENHPGEQLLKVATGVARGLWGERLLAVYAIGSLAHGGFSVHVSDVDVALIVQDPLQPADASSIDQLLSRLQGGNVPFADRLSLFWGSPGSLAGGVSGGRFPAADRLDLKNSGRLLAGRDLRTDIIRPTLNELVVDGAVLALQKLSTPAVVAKIRDPIALAGSDAIRLTKWLLFPVRLLFTLRTGEVAEVDRAVQHFCSVTSGPEAKLARCALGWRFAPPPPHDPDALEVIAQGAVPFYRRLLDEYGAQLRCYGRLDLADAFRDWHCRLAHQL